MFEVDYPNLDMAHEALRLAMHKLPIKCKIVAKENQTKPNMSVVTNSKEEILGEANGNANN